MNYRYKVKGRAKKAFILRGMHFRVGSPIDNQILDSELEFVKERCELEKVEDLTITQKPIPTNSQTTPKGVKNEQSKSTSGANKVTNKAKI